MEIKVKTVVVTGAGQGLGFSLVKKHVEMGDRVYAYELNLTKELIDYAMVNENLSIHQCDVASSESVNNATKEMLKKEDFIHFLYNNAGIFRYEDRVSLLETDIDAASVQLQVNAVGLLRMCKAVMQKLGSGSMVVNITSESGSIGDCYRDNEYLYGMSKAAANMASMIFQNEMGKYGVRVICFHPGWLRSKMGGQGAAESPHSVSCDESASNIMSYALNPERIPEGVYFMEHSGKPLPW
ncbi:MAG: SDR family NAD(P)-dependent oxidoreductase [Lachnospiraceae bacterium]|nr:SDR family NAD(P)-dependent oxidoreductase [Lachnospiraceae bacterium]